jgi:hypothetical protein
MGIFMNIAQFEDDIERKSYIAGNIKWLNVELTHWSVFVMYIPTDTLTSNGSSKMIRHSTCYAALYTRDSNSAACCNHRILFQLSIIVISGCPLFIKTIQYNKTSGIQVYISRPFGN